MSEHSPAIKRRVEEDSSSTLKLTRLSHHYEKLNQASEQTYDTAVLLLRSIYTLILVVVNLLSSAPSEPSRVCALLDMLTLLSPLLKGSF